MLVFLRCDFISSISFVHIRATRETKKQLVYGYFFFTLVHFLLLFFPFVFLAPLLSSMFIASDSKLPYNNPVMILAMISTSIRRFEQAQRWFPCGHSRRCGFCLCVLRNAGRRWSGYKSLVNVPSRQWHASWDEILFPGLHVMACIAWILLSKFRSRRSVLVW